MVPADGFMSQVMLKQMMPYLNKTKRFIYTITLAWVFTEYKYTLYKTPSWPSSPPAVQAVISPRHR